MNEEQKNKDLQAQIEKQSSKLAQSAPLVQTWAEVDEGLNTKTDNWELIASYREVVKQVQEELQFGSLEKREKFYNSYMLYHFFLVPLFALVLTSKQAFGYGSLTIYLLKDNLTNNELNRLTKEPKTFMDGFKIKMTLALLPVMNMFKLTKQIKKITFYDA